MYICKYIYIFIYVDIYLDLYIVNIMYTRWLFWMIGFKMFNCVQSQAVFTGTT